jgi:hypothetical protein
MFVLSQKLKMVKDKLKTWNKACFGNVNDLVCAAELKLAQIQMQIQEHGHSDVLMFKVKLASTELEEALTKEEVFWQEKARLNWHLEGDRNTNFSIDLPKSKTQPNRYNPYKMVTQ